MKMAYLFMKFDFEEFNKGKLYMVKEAREKYAWDNKERKETDEYEGVQLKLEIKQDTYKYPTKDGDVEGLNLNEELTVIVEDGKIDDYKSLVTEGFSAPIPVEIVDWTDVTYFDRKGTNATLRVTGDVKEANQSTTTSTVTSSY